MIIVNKIIETARSFQGQQEIRGNKGFKNKWFQDLMMRMGWKKFQAWCSYFTEAVWKEAYAEFSADIVLELDKLFSASAVQTWKNFSNSPRWTTFQIPIIGSLAVWQYYENGKRTWKGHIGIVEQVLSDNRIRTIDGNTNYGKSREGFVVAPVNRKIDFKEENGLRLLGFVYPRALAYKKDPINFKKLV